MELPAGKTESNNFNKQGGGRLITNYPRKEQLTACFTFMLAYDWAYDNDIREVWAENGFYCIIDYLNTSDNPMKFLTGGLNLFLLLYYGHKDLNHQVEFILQRALMFGNPYFDFDDSTEGVINQFFYIAAKMLERYSPILKGEAYDKFKKVLTWKEIEEIPAQRIMQKASFIAKVIHSILEKM